jgi:hypothetical protein
VAANTNRPVLGLRKGRKKMPTGYTAAIKDGISLRQFILSCSRAMGACIMQRDDPVNEPPKKREPSNYHTERLAAAEMLLSDIKAMRDDVADEKAKEEYKRELESIETGIREKNNLKCKYDSMLANVRSWEPPTPEHQGLKDFMVSQISDSINFDCGSDYYIDKAKELRPLSASEWKSKEVNRALRDIDYHQREHNEDLKRCKSQNIWIEKLYGSLPNEELPVLGEEAATE